MALSSSVRLERASIAQRLGMMLHVHYDTIANEPLPQYWVDLIHRLREEEQAQAADQPDASPRVERPGSG